MQPLTANDPLAVAVKKWGGINPHYARDMRHGEIRRITEARRGLPPGAINSKAPLTLEDIAARAHQTGYIVDEEMDTFLDALEQDVAAKNNNDPKKRVYSYNSDIPYQLSQPRDYHGESESLMSAAIEAPMDYSSMTTEQQYAELLRLEAENAALKARNNKGLYMKVSEKGGVSVYGLNSKFPVTLYELQWIALLDMADDIRAFMEEHKAQLKTKSVKQ